MTDNSIIQVRKDIKSALPTFGLKDERQQERMSSVLMVAIERDPELVFADRQSLIAAIRQCANHGLVPDGNEATLQVYSTKVRRAGKEEWIKKVQYQPMVRGIINRILNSGKVKTVWADCVFEGETFRIDTSHGDRRPIHDPDHFNRSNKFVGVYAVAVMTNGAIDCEPMGKRDIEKVMAVAKTKNVWNNWFEEKAKVAAIRRLSKRLPLSSEDMTFIMNEAEHDLSRDVKDISPPDEPEKPYKTLAQKLSEADTEPEAIEGEVLHMESEAPADEAPKHDPHSQEYDEGIIAAQEGKKMAECPYKNDPQKLENWIAGFKSEAER